MKELLRLQGGYPRATDYILSLQTEFLTASNSLLNGLGVDLVLSGCAVVDNGNGTINIAAGLVYVSGEILRFDGADNVLTDGTKAMVKDAYATTDPKEFQDETTKNIYREAKAIVGAYAGVTQIVIKLSLTTLRTYIQDLASGAAFPGEKRYVKDLDGTFLDNFDASGLGVTFRYLGWALENGNNDLPNTAGRVTITAGTYTDPSTGLEIVYAPGDIGGAHQHKLIMSELPKFKRPKLIPDTDRGSNASKFSLDDEQELGGDQPHNNMQPYIAEYCIVRLY